MIKFNGERSSETIMLAIKILDVKDFMNQLLLQSVFDDFLFCEGTVKTGITFIADGKINKDFFDSEELSQGSLADYTKWQSQKHIFYEIIKGKKTPLYFKLIFMLSKEQLNDFLLKHNVPMKITDVAGLFFNVYYDKNTLTITSGTSLKVFQLDKTLDTLWDEALLQYLKKNAITYEAL